MGKPVKPFIVPVFIPHAGCVHRCVFCDQVTITGGPREVPSPPALRAHIGAFLAYRAEWHGPAQIAFYGGNFLGLDLMRLQGLLRTANEFVADGRAESIRISTRPDTIDPERLNTLRPFPVTTVELGVQSMDDDVLDLSARGHTTADTRRAVDLLRKSGLAVGCQLMVGLPGDDRVRSRRSAHRVAALQPDFVRIYPTVVLAGSPLARWYAQGKYRPLELAQCVAQVKDLYLFFRRRNITVIRMGLQATADLVPGATIVAGPYHPAFGHLVHAAIFRERAGEKIAATARDSVILAVHPHSVSRLRGLKNVNIAWLTEQFQLRKLEIVTDPTLAPEEVALR
jgi:histone acetyltransferase (RNA polymerase elongator complex component)